MCDTGDLIAELDTERAQRRGYPEAIYCEGKSVDHVRTIARMVTEHPEQHHLFTRADEERAQAVLSILPDAFYDATAHFLAWPATPPHPTGELVIVACAGTSDLPVAREALHTASYLGRPTRLVPDIGIAGLHRALSKLDLLRSAGAIVVAAGMDGALPGLIAGLVSAPVIALPTSVGYGAAFEGLAPLLTMLNACSPGIGVVNINNGYGAGHLAAQITAPRHGLASDEREETLHLP